MTPAWRAAPPASSPVTETAARPVWRAAAVVCRRPGGRAGGRGPQPSAFFLRLNDFFTLPSTSTSTPWLRMMMYCWVKVMVLLATQ